MAARKPAPPPPMMAMSASKTSMLLPPATPRAATLPPPIRVDGAHERHVLGRIEAHGRVVRVEERNAVEAPRPLVQPRAVVHHLHPDVRVLLERVGAGELEAQVAEGRVRDEELAGGELRLRRGVGARVEPGPVDVAVV